MNEWKYTLDLSDIYHSDLYNLPEKAGIIAMRIQGSKFYGTAWGSEIADVVEEFLDLNEEYRADVAWFDAIMSSLYDLADSSRVWIKTR